MPEWPLGGLQVRLMSAHVVFWAEDFKRTVLSMVGLSRLLGILSSG
jgi:hypothetical protein